MSARQPSNQELRARKDLLLAAGRLLKAGRKPTMDDVAREALISRATAYRHFGSIDALLVEVPIDAAVTDPAEIFAGNTSTDVEARAVEAEASMHKVTYENEAQLRVLLSKTVARDADDDDTPRRQNRRTPLIEAALAPGRDRFSDDSYRKLCAALALIFGTEAMIVFRDVLRLDERTAKKVKSWAVQALVRAALEESKNIPRAKRSGK